MILSIRHLTKTYDMGGENVVHALADVDLEVERGEFMSIMGPSGSGKSTLLNMIGCLDRPDSGSIAIDGVDVTSIPARKLPDVRGRKVGFIFQTFNLVPTLSAIENVELPMRYAGIKGKKARPAALQALAKVGLEDRASHFPAQLSGGQAQRVAIARALVLEPAIILADEPTGQLDSRSSQLVMDMLRELSETQGQTFIIVTHDPIVGAATDRVVRMSDGGVASDEQTHWPELKQEPGSALALRRDAAPAAVTPANGNGRLDRQMQHMRATVNAIIADLEH